MTIQYKCMINLDEFKMAMWPTEFPQVPNIGDMVQGVCRDKTPRLVVSSVAYCLDEDDPYTTIVEIWLDVPRFKL